MTLQKSATSAKKAPKKALQIRVKDVVRAKHRTIVSPENNLLSSSSVSGRRPPNTASGATRTKLFAKRPIERENPARSILELEQKFSKVYVQSSSLVATQRSYSNYYTSNMDNVGKSKFYDNVKFSGQRTYEHGGATISQGDDSEPENPDDKVDQPENISITNDNSKMNLVVPASDQPNVKL